jgi:hypothetical protein
MIGSWPIAIPGLASNGLAGMKRNGRLAPKSVIAIEEA